MATFSTVNLELSDKEFDLIANLVHKEFGIHLGKNKKGLVISRLRKLILSKDMKSFSEYYDFVKSDTTGIELLTLVDKISTNHSFFFREVEHFNFLKRVLPKLINSPSVRSKKRLTVWSAGCASGEEPYTIAMILHDLQGDVLKGVEVKILATDISLSVLAVAKKGEYSADKLKLVPGYFLKKYFNRIDDDTYGVKEVLKKMILFKSLNLMRESFPFKGKFDVIFCRNVMIYFTGETRNALVNRFIRYMNPGSFLFIGHSESLGRNHPELSYIEPAVYYYG